MAALGKQVLGSGLFCLVNNTTVARDCDKEEKMSAMYFSIPRLAERLGITPASVRLWIKSGYVEVPPELPVTGERAYPIEAAQRIERWYQKRAASGKTRGPGARKRRERARQSLSENSDNLVFSLAEEPNK